MTWMNFSIIRRNIAPKDLNAILHPKMGIGKSMSFAGIYLPKNKQI